MSVTLKKRYDYAAFLNGELVGGEKSVDWTTVLDISTCEPCLQGINVHGTSECPFETGRFDLVRHGKSSIEIFTHCGTHIDVLNLIFVQKPLN